MAATDKFRKVEKSLSAYDVIFAMAKTIVRDLADHASLADETCSWSYQHDRDLAGFIDGSENPSLLEATGAALVSAGVSSATGSVLLLQK